MMKRIYTHYIIGVLMAVLLVACDAHRDFPDTAMKPCHILCTDFIIDANRAHITADSTSSS